MGYLTVKSTSIPLFVPAVSAAPPLPPHTPLNQDERKIATAFFPPGEVRHMN